MPERKKARIGTQPTACRLSSVPEAAAEVEEGQEEGHDSRLHGSAVLADIVAEDGIGAEHGIEGAVTDPLIPPRPTREVPRPLTREVPVPPATIFYEERAADSAVDNDASGSATH